MGAGGWFYASGTAARLWNDATEEFYRVSAANGFYVRDVLVEGRVYADPALLLALLNVSRGDPVFAFNPESARLMLERHEWIESARVERRLPGLVYVHLRERQPFALWQHQGRLRLIDSYGVVITDSTEDMARFQSLPLVVGDGAAPAARHLLGLMQAEPLLMERLEAAVYVGGRRWDLKMKSGAMIRLPESDLALALRRLAGAQEQDRLIDGALESIDLREANRMIVRTRPGTVQDYQASFKTGSAI